MLDEKRRPTIMLQRRGLKPQGSLLQQSLMMQPAMWAMQMMMQAPTVMGPSAPDASVAKLPKEDDAIATLEHIEGYIEGM